LVLGSRSPRRKEILLSLGLSPIVRPAEVDESPHPGEAPLTYVERVTRAKHAAVRDLVSGAESAVLVADTTVTRDSAILGKPQDDDEAFAMLRSLAGRRHLVLTSYALSVVGRPESSFVLRTIETEVRMRQASDEELHGYVRTGECRDKAGAYAIQGRGAFLVEAISGSYSGVVGLPICELVVDLRALGVLGSYP
jgi:septum formation protein